MSEWKSNIPSDLDLDIHYSPAKSENQKKKLSKTMKAVAIERNRDPIYIEKLHDGIANRDNTYQAECNAKLEVREKISKSMKGYKKTTEHEAKIAEDNKKKHQDPEYRKKYEAGLAKRDRKFHAGEYGIFTSRIKAIEYAKSKGLSNAQSKIERWTKENPTEYYYIEMDKE